MLKFDIIGTSLLFLAFFIEFAIILIHKAEKKQMKDMGANLVLGLCIVLVGLLEKAMAFSFFSFVYHFTIFTPRPHWWLWIICFLGCDFIHYAYHWLGHRTRIFWAAHVTHHSSKYFNLSTGLRTNFFHLFYRFLFWSPLCLLGFPPQMILFFESITAIANFLVHTERIGKLGILDWFLNTPSNHRVHHAVNPEYIDKNLGGMLMIYDHLFGTYAKEKAQPVYGITHDIDTHNPVDILLHEYKSLNRDSSRIRGFTAKLRHLFSPP